MVLFVARSDRNPLPRNLVRPPRPSALLAGYLFLVYESGLSGSEPSTKGSCSFIADSEYDDFSSSGHQLLPIISAVSDLTVFPSGGV